MHSASKRFQAVGLTVVLLLSLIIVLAGLKEPEREPMRFSFLSFTNVGAGPEAVFLAQFPPDFTGGGWRNPQVSIEKDGVWKSWKPTNSAAPPMRVFQWPMPTNRIAGKREQRFKGTTYFAFTVRATNELSRIVIQVDESRPMGRLARLRKWLGMPVSAPPPGRSYFLTNETRARPVVE